MNIERLQREADLLERVHRDGKDFDIRFWIDTRGGILPYHLDHLIDQECGTAACAIGWALRDPWFREQGLGVRIIEQTWVIPPYIIPTFREHTGFSAVAAFFEIEYDDAEALFHAGGYRETPTALDVRQAILRFIARKQEVG